MSPHLFRKTMLGKSVQFTQNKWLRLEKRLYWKFCSRQNEMPQLLFIMACMRSGTSLLGHVFERDIRTTSLHEDSCITGQWEKRLRMLPYPQVRRILESLKTPLVIAKPLVESQNAREILENIPHSQAVWMFRHYKDVASSNVKRFHSQLHDVQAIVHPEPGNWRSEKVSDHVRSTLARFYSVSMSPYDAAALFWYARNRLFFEQELETHPQVTLCKYEDLVTHPEETMHRLYEFMGTDYPSQNITAVIDSRSLGLGSTIHLQSEVEELCSGLMEQLEDVYQLHTKHLQES